MPAHAPLKESRLVSRSLLPPLTGSEQKTRVEADGHVVRVEQVRGKEECEGFAVLIEHMLLRVNNDILHGGQNLGSDLQLS